MGKIIEYVILLSNLSLIIRAAQYEDAPGNYEREGNFTVTIKQFFPKDQNGMFNKKVGVSPSDFQERRGKVSPRSPHMSKTPGLQAFATRDPPLKIRRKQPSAHWRNAVSASHRPSQTRKNYRYFYPPNWAGKGTIPKINPRPSFDQSSSHKPHEDSVKSSSSKDWRSPRLSNARHTPKVCNPCNDVPWVPLLNVPDSYRKQRTHITELHKTPSEDFDFKGFASDTHNVLLPPVPLVPPLQAIYDGTISSSFGLPVGNIPTAHGMLAPINHLAAKVNHYGLDTIDFGHHLKFFPTQSALETNAFPQLSPVPIVPIHESTTFYSTITNLVPPTTKTVDVSKVVLTIAEDGPPKVNSDPGKLHAVFGKDLSSQSSSLVGFQSSHTQNDEYPLYPPYPPYSALQNKYQDFGRLEIVKSIPLAEWQISNQVKSDNPPLQTQFPANPPLQTQFPANPPLQTQFPANPPVKPHFHESNPLHQPNTQKDINKPLPNYSDFLVPPPTKRAESDTSFNASKSGILPFLHPPKDSHVGESVKSSTVPEPLTSPSLNWLFSDHQTQATTPKPADPASLDTQHIASIVNNELRPVSPHPFPISSPASSNSDASKSKKIQIIIPYTTKNKNGYDNNALESVRHEVFQTIQPPVSITTHENNSSRDSATPALPSSPDRAHHHMPEADRNRKVIDSLETGERGEEEDSPEILFDDVGNKYLADMQHIIATNLRELLREEIEKSQSDQNYPLQNNIDNWTALEYSNHKTVSTKEPKEIITQALAVTSIPGTSISHLLLPSKKIPDKYFATTPLPVFDEPTTAVYNATNTTVDSKPFTAKPYATTNVYVPTRNLKQLHNNHEKNYTEVGRGKVNNWGRLNENLVLPEARSRVRKVEATTVSAWTDRFVSGENDKVQIVTPVSSSARNHTAFGYKRTTRQVHTTEKSTTPKSKANRTSPLINNSTKLEKVSNLKIDRKPNLRLVNSTVQRQNHSESSKTNANTTKVSETSLSDKLSEELISSRKTNSSELFSINDVFPFRNQQLPWEPQQNVTLHNSPNNRKRKSLIKQFNLQKPKTTAADSS